MYKLIFKHPEQSTIYQPLKNALLAMCQFYRKDAECVRGYSSLESQKVTNAWVLSTRKGSYQEPNGAVYTGKGKNRICWASAYGESNHYFTIAMDFDGWIEGLTAKQLAVFGLCSPVLHEPWHIQLISLTGIGKAQKETIRNATLKGGKKDMTTKGFQKMTGLFEDDIAGPITKNKATEILKVCHSILGINVEADLRTVTNIINKLGGK